MIDTRLTLAGLLLASAAVAQPLPSPGTPVQPPSPPAAGTGSGPPALTADVSLTAEVRGAIALPAPLPKIDPKTPLKDLLPAAPKAAGKVYTGDDLAAVPEIRLAGDPGELTSEQWRNRKAGTAAAALHLNAKEEDGYLKALLKDRKDLAGVPFAMGGACRTKLPRAAAFKLTAARLLGTGIDALPAAHAAILAGVPKDDERAEHLSLSHMAAMTQIHGPADAATRQATVKALAAIARPEATRELARMAVFSTNKAVRADALEALSVRRERDYTAVLTEALRYPWPAVAANAAEAIVKLEREDLLPQLIDVLEEPDPRGPRAEGGKKVARELVRVNHHSNCMLCHAPTDRVKVHDDLLAEMPVPSDPLPEGTQGYGRAGSNLLVRIDVTYLRQDFSVMQSVEEKSKWPAMQRFDFVVRKRELSADEAKELADRLERREAGVLSPYQKAAVSALRKLTGRDFEAKAEPWRKLLKAKAS